MKKYKFYTPPGLSECLMALLPQEKYENIIDICCGSWNLLEAARKRFGSANYVGVDIDEEAQNNCFAQAVFRCEDGRTFSMEEKERYDLILSNPPFGYLKEEERVFADEATEAKCIKGLCNKRYENEMIQANLFLAKESGVMLFILPKTFFEGDSYQSIRRELCRKYTVLSVIELPIETFGSSKISTYALIMANSGKQKQRARLQRITHKREKWEVEEIAEIAVDRLLEGTWIREHSKQKMENHIDIFRGSITSSQFNKSGTGIEVYHNSSIIRDGIWRPSLRYCNDKKYLDKSQTAMPGDIIVNRVGKSAGYWCLNEKECIVSDCLFVVRASGSTDICSRLIQNSIRGRLNVAVRGVTTKYITKRDILDLL